MNIGGIWYFKPHLIVLDKLASASPVTNCSFAPPLVWKMVMSCSFARHKRDLPARCNLCIGMLPLPNWPVSNADVLISPRGRHWHPGWGGSTPTMLWHGFLGLPHLKPRLFTLAIQPACLVWATTPGAWKNLVVNLVASWRNSSSMKCIWLMLWINHSSFTTIYDVHL